MAYNDQNSRPVKAPVGKIPEIQGAGEGNRTLTTSLEGWSSTIELHPRNRKSTILTMELTDIAPNIPRNSPPVHPATFQFPTH